MTSSTTSKMPAIQARLHISLAERTIDSMVEMKNTPGKVGIALCGGGSRAMSAGLGQLRGLAHLRPKGAAADGPPLLGLTKGMSVVSGGAWLTAPFTFLPEDVSDQAYLGTYVEDPGRLIRRRRPMYPIEETLDQLPEGYAGGGIGSPRFTVVGLALQAVLLKRFAKVATHRLWQTMIGLNILKPYGLYRKNKDFEPSSTFSLDSVSHRRELLELNPKLADYPVHLVTVGESRIRRPFWICNTSMFVNEPEANGEQLVPVQSTPLYTGILSRPDAVDANGKKVGGGAVASFAFSSDLLGTGDSMARVETPRLFSLSDIVGLSSVAYASGLEQKIDEWRNDHVPLAEVLMERDADVEAWFEEHFESKLPEALKNLLHKPKLREFLRKSGIGEKVGLKIDADLHAAIEEIQNFIPEEMYWPVATDDPRLHGKEGKGEKGDAGVEKAPVATRFADGGNLENTGVASLLTYSDIHRIIAFVNSPTLMKTVDVGVLSPADSEGKSQEIPDTRILIDSQISVLFGYRAHLEGVGYRLYADTDPADIPAAERPFQVNQVFPSGDFPELMRGLWAASHGLQRPALFEQTLETVDNETFGIRGGRKVRVLWYYLDKTQDWLDRLSDNVRGLLNEKGYENFPCFPTNQGLDATQINLLAHLTSWCVADPSNRAAFQRMYEA